MGALMAADGAHSYDPQCPCPACRARATRDRVPPPIEYALRFAQCGGRLIFENRNVHALWERLGRPESWGWWTLYQGEEYRDERSCRRRDFAAMLPGPGRGARFFDSWEEAEGWLCGGDGGRSGG
jgi:hypothetical protein